LDITNIRCDLIEADEDWNCRDAIIPANCIELSNSIRENGLLQPVIIRPMGDVYSLVAGFRRFFCVSKLLQWDTIPAIIKDMDLIEAKQVNLAENFARKDLNFLEEAKALQYFTDRGYKSSEVVNMVGKSYGWCQPRFQLVRLPVGIQQAAASGAIRPSQIKKLFALRNEPEEVMKARAKELIDETLTGKKTQSRLTKKIDKTVKQLRTEEGMNVLIDKLLDAIEIGEDTEKSRILGFGARCVACCAGNISEDELDSDIHKVKMG
jgi:ParB/RepB/Spo0J family partition protein